MSQDTQPERTIPTILSTLKAGLDLTTRNWWLVILPFLLNTLLWLGPRLRVADLIINSPDFNDSLALIQQSQPEGSTELVMTVIEQFNLLAFLSVPLVGVPTLFSGVSPEAIPIPVIDYQVPNWGNLWANIIVMMAIGVLVSTMFHGLLTRLVAGAGIDWEDFGRSFFPTALYLFTLLILAIIGLFLLSIPISLMAVVSSLINPAIGIFVLLAGSVLLMWAIIFLSFCLPTLLFHAATPINAMRDSIRFLQKNLTSALPLLMFIFLIRSFTNNLWISADDGSWLTIVSMIGHAFIATALAASLFIFYRDRAVVTREDSVISAP